jgi:hypothetical protein
VLLADLVVVGAVAGRRVHEPGAGLEGDVVGEPDAEVGVGARRLDERVAVARALELLEARPRDVDPGRLVDGQLARLEERLRARLGDEQVLTVGASRRHRDVLVRRLQDDGEVRRQGPRRRRPDDQADRLAGQAVVEHAAVLLERHAHVDRR